MAGLGSVPTYSRLPDGPIQLNISGMLFLRRRPVSLIKLDPYQIMVFLNQLLKDLKARNIYHGMLMKLALKQILAISMHHF
jgi:hypothetical protein